MNAREKRTAVLAAAGIIAVVLLAAGGYLLDRFTARPGQNGPVRTVEDILGREEAPVSFNGRQYRRKADVKAYLFMGVDRTGTAQSSGSYNGGGQADVQLLLVVDQVQGSFKVLQINRDTMTDVEVLGVQGDVIGTEYQQIALAHFYGDGLEESCENAVRAVSDLLYGMDIDGYAAIQMEAIPIINDMVGGVTVTVEDDFSKADPSLVQGETVTLHGEQALHFIRNRLDVADGSNLSRMRRHQTYLHGFEEAFHDAAETDRELVLRIYDAVHDYLVTDLGSKSISRLARQCQDYENGGVVTVDGEVRQGETFMEFYPDETSLRQVVLDLFYTEVSEE